MSSRFKNPGGNLGWTSVLMMLGGIFLCFHYAANGPIVLSYAMGILAFLAAMLWYQQKWAGWLLLLLCGLGVFSGVMVLLFVGFQWPRVLRLASSVYLFVELWRWVNGETETQSDMQDELDTLHDEEPAELDLQEGLMNEDVSESAGRKRPEKRRRWRSQKPGDTFEI